jgi:hypothetical protein
MINLSEQYRVKALACEKLGRDATDADTRSAWAEIAIEWHALASRMAIEAAPLLSGSQAVEASNRHLNKIAAPPS